MDTRIGMNLVDIDHAPIEERRRLQSLLLFRLFRHALRHPLTSDRLSRCSPAAGPDSILAEWGKIALSATEDHSRLIRDHRAELVLLSQGRSASVVFSSGGTTGAPKFTFLSFDEVLRNTRFHGKGYRLAGITEAEVVATFGLPGLLSSEFTVYHGLEQTGCTLLPIGSMGDPDVIVDLCDRLGVTALVVMPSELTPVLDALEHRGRSLQRVRLVVTGGEAMPGALKERAGRALGGAVRFRSTFQTSDTGTIGYQCDHCEDGEYHVHEALQYVEAVPSKEVEGASELVVTNLDRYLVPVIRMKTGDLISWSTGGCGCGRTSTKLRVLGRCSRFQKLGGEKLDTAIFVEMSQALGLQLEEIAVKFDTDARGRDRLVIALCPRALEDPETLQRARALLFTRSEKLREQVEVGTIAPIEIVPLEPGARRFSKSGKRILVSDERAPEAFGAEPPSKRRPGDCSYTSFASS